MEYMYDHVTHLKKHIVDNNILSVNNTTVL